MENLDWLDNEIRRGLSKLVCLCLDSAPAADLIEGTAQSWLEALTFRRAWDAKRDMPRVREAFTTLMRTSRRWPTVPDFDSCLPRVEQMLALPAKPTDPERALRAIAEAQALLDADRPKPPPVPDPEPRPDLSSVEADLREHYDRKRVAAGDVS